mgnify:CR=1 FL=1
MVVNFRVVSRPKKGYCPAWAAVQAYNALLAAIAAPLAAHAQDWPTKPIRMIVPLAAGSAVDGAVCVNSLVKLALGLANVPDELIADIDKNLPGAERLVAASRAIQPHLEALVPIAEEMKPHIDALLPLVEKAMPHVNAILPVVRKVSPDLKNVLPVLHGAVAFVEGRTRSS